MRFSASNTLSSLYLSALPLVSVLFSAPPPRRCQSLTLFSNSALVGAEITTSTTTSTTTTSTPTPTCYTCGTPVVDTDAKPLLGRASDNMNLTEFMGDDGCKYLNVTCAGPKYVALEWPVPEGGLKGLHAVSFLILEYTKSPEYIFLSAKFRIQTEWSSHFVALSLAMHYEKGCSSRHVSFDCEI